MRLFVKEWPNKTATLMTENGQVVWTFGSVAGLGKPVASGVASILNMSTARMSLVPVILR